MGYFFFKWKTMALLYRSDLLILFSLLIVFTIAFNLIIWGKDTERPKLVELHLSVEPQLHNTNNGFAKSRLSFKEPIGNPSTTTPISKFLKKDFIKDSQTTKTFSVIKQFSLQTDKLQVPLGGKLQGGRAHCKIYDFSTTKIQNVYECRNLTLPKAIPVCLYTDAEDIHVSYHIRREGIWEQSTVSRIWSFFSNASPDIGFIDIGAHIGQYSLVVASLGHRVVAVEPFLESIYRMKAAAQLGNINGLITVVENAIFDKRALAQFGGENNNKGGTQLSPETICNYSPNCSYSSVQTILMDDLLEVINFRRAIMKIDIEGQEHRAFLQSEQLFKQVTISHIFMEWMKLREYFGTRQSMSEDKDLVYDLIDVLEQRGYTPQTYTGSTLAKAAWYGWPDDIVWIHHTA